LAAGPDHGPRRQVPMPRHGHRASAPLGPWQLAPAVSARAAWQWAQAQPAAGCGLSALRLILAGARPSGGRSALAHGLARYRRGDRRWSRVQHRGLLDKRARAWAALLGHGADGAVGWWALCRLGSPACPPFRHRLQQPEPATKREFDDLRSLPETGAIHPTNEIGVPFFTRRASASASQLVRRMHPCDCVLPTLSASGVP
jgi:hypothetical protein